MQNYLVTAVQQDLTGKKDKITTEEKYQVALDGICKEHEKWEARFDKKLEAGGSPSICRR